MCSAYSGIAGQFQTGAKPPSLDQGDSADD